MQNPTNACYTVRCRKMEDKRKRVLPEGHIEQGVVVSAQDRAAVREAREGEVACSE
jgi:hypothetical protein